MGIACRYALQVGRTSTGIACPISPLTSQLGLPAIGTPRPITCYPRKWRPPYCFIAVKKGCPISHWLLGQPLVKVAYSADPNCCHAVWISLMA
ncbi:hypothetical protein PghCCS26_54670 [Paenibacillus glycanilyticus]|uniref:Uncharacterized protein n=1 Tax=Paenibacillus glycanilyticus TaxID=126569 RepID=A0ABQ6NVR6_9BACL|nr:hypothetical protein PghCCS26_54670 [Paenibacillus glycanilyticus]